MKPFKKGMIMLWSGSIATIPKGWALCNGSNGTPNLRNRFIVGAGDTYNPADTGGNINHTHAFTSAYHTHYIGEGHDMFAGLGYASITNGSVVSGTTDAKDGRPPYYALAYIMKI